MDTAIIATLLIALLIFILWDRKQPSRPISREKLTSGYRPGESAKKTAISVMGFIAIFASIKEAIDPTLPPFTGHSAAIHQVVYNISGPYGASIVFGCTGLALFVTLIFSVRKTRSI